MSSAAPYGRPLTWWGKVETIAVWNDGLFISLPGAAVSDWPLPAPDFVIRDGSGALRAMLECKRTNDGGTARDKALRFERPRDESVRLGGTPLIAVLGGLGWTRVNDTLGPVVRDCDGRVFSIGNLRDMLTVAPFPSLVGLARLAKRRSGGTIMARDGLQADLDAA
jgi:hypothetical protein